MLLIVGAGAVGTILAGYAMRGAQAPVRLYIRDEDIAGVQSVEQIRVEHVRGGRPPVLANKPTLTRSLDLSAVRYLVICVKFPQLDSVLDALPDIPPGCTVVSTLNGVGGLRRIHQRFPDARVVPMTIMFNGQWLAPLHARITTKPRVLLGCSDPALLSTFADTGMAVDVVEGEAAVWGKLLINLGNAVCAATHASFKDLITHPDLKACYFGVFDEAAKVLDQAGIRFSLPLQVPLPLYQTMFRFGGPLVWWLARLRNGLQAGSYPSMVADIDAGRPTEIRQLNGEIVAIAEQTGIDAPFNQRLCALIAAMEGKPAKPLTAGELRERLGIPR